LSPLCRWFTRRSFKNRAEWMTESNALRRSIKQAWTFLDLFKYLSIIVFSLNMWSDVRNEMLKYGNFVLQPCLVKLFNIILSSGIYPTELVQGLIFPIYKTGDPLNPSNYRGIVITSCLSKLFNSILGCNTKLPYLSISFKMLSEPLFLPFFFTFL
jgi:hypothetical protein